MGTTGNGGEDHDSGCCDIHVVPASREHRSAVVRAGGGYCNDGWVCCWIHDLTRHPAVAGCRDDHHSGRHGDVDRIGEQRIAVRTTE
jgi:hypothetical protein